MATFLRDIEQLLSSVLSLLLSPNFLGVWFLVSFLSLCGRSKGLSLKNVPTMLEIWCLLISGVFTGPMLRSGQKVVQLFSVQKIRSDNIFALFHSGVRGFATSQVGDENVRVPRNYRSRSAEVTREPQQLFEMCVFIASCAKLCFSK